MQAILSRWIYTFVAFVSLLSPVFQDIFTAPVLSGNKCALTEVYSRVEKFRITFFYILCPVGMWQPPLRLCRMLFLLKFSQITDNEKLKMYFMKFSRIRLIKC
jgi:hypothetical protein